MNDNKFDAYFDLVTHFELYPSKTGLKHRLNYMFKDITFQGKSMLDIGAGSGLFSLYGACMGASSVTALEPELAGGMKGTTKILTQLSERLPQYHISPLMVSFQDFDPANQTFDVILLVASINHLDEEACINLQNSEDARNKYRSIFQKLNRIASPQAKLIISDCSRYTVFTRLGLHNPLSSNIEWHKHQAPEYWARMLRDFGFTNPKIRWESPGARYAPGRWLFRNRVGAYLTTSSFNLVMEKSGHSA
jgi:SAM-dependent methyltransferase